MSGATATAARYPDLARTAAEVLCLCAVRADERIALLVDDATAPALRKVFLAALRDSGVTDPVVLSLRPRKPAFADLPELALDMLLTADVVLDLTTVPWLYSDSFTRFARECGPAGTRLAMIWGSEESLRTFAVCPPSARLAQRCRRALPLLERARRLHAWSTSGTDFTAELGDPEAYPRSFIGEPPIRAGMIAAPLCASVTAPFVFGTARGSLIFDGAGRFQGPENRPLRASDPVSIIVDEGHVVRVDGDRTTAITLADWFDRAGFADGSLIMDCNIGFDPRANLRWADNTVIHSFAGGLMIGFGNPYEFRPEGSRRPGYHLDLMFSGLDVDLDDVPLIRGGHITAESGLFEL